MARAAGAADPRRPRCDTQLTETENMTTLLVAVPKHLTKDFLGTYEKLSTFVVPRSAKLARRRPHTRLPPVPARR